MKTLLVPTDFSETAEQAAFYAAELAALSSADLILFHAYYIPTIVSDSLVALPNPKEIEEACYQQLDLLKNKLYKKHGSKFFIHCACRCGFAVDEINQWAIESKADLMVMGIHGSGFITEKLIGSVTTELLPKASCPVLVIGKNMVFKKLEKIVLAYDLHKLSDKHKFSILKELSDLCLSHLYIVHIENQPDLYDSVLKDIREAKLRHWFDTIYCTFHALHGHDVCERLNEFINDYQADMLVMVPREHSFFENIFHQSVTKRMAFHAKTPLLFINELS